MEAWSLIFTILSFIVACFSLWAMIKIAISTSKLETDRSNLFAEMLRYVKSIAPKEETIQSEVVTKQNELEETSEEVRKESFDKFNKNLEAVNELGKENEKKQNAII